MKEEKNNEKPYFINRENGIFVVSSRHYSIEEINKYNSEIEKVLFDNGYQGNVLFDYFICFGTNHNRFINRYFDGKSFVKEKTGIAVIPIDFIKQRNKQYLTMHRKNTEQMLKLNNTKESSVCAESVLLNDLEKCCYPKPTLKQLMDEIMFSSWGLRGDPYLWKEIKEIYGTEIISLEDIEPFLYETFFDLTNKTMNCEEYIFCERHAHGGMSSGHLSSKFWVEKALPALIAQRKLYID